LHQLDEGHGSSIALTGTYFEHTCVSPVAARKAGPNIREELVYDSSIFDRRQDLTTIVDAALLRLGDEVFGVGAQ
jgi:hypothetical protein